MKILKKLFLSVLLLSIMACSSDSVVKGTIDETDTSIMGLVTPVGVPAVGVEVKVYRQNDTSDVALDTLITDSAGEYSLKNLPEGNYSLWAEADNFVHFNDSIAINDSVLNRSVDTLFIARKIRIPVKVEVQHLPSIIEAHILGTHLHPVVDNNGYLTLDKIPEGEFSIRLSTREPHYTARTWFVTIDENSPDTLTETLSMIYTGVPVVTGVRASYDTLTGVAKIQWNSVDYSQLDKYEILRDLESAPSLSSEPIASTADTIYFDTIPSGTQAGTYRYRVTVRNSIDTTSGGHSKDTIEYVDPKIELNILPDTVISTSLHYPQEIPISVPTWLAANPSGIYYIDNDSVELSTSELTNCTITFHNSYSSHLPLVVTLRGNTGRELTDTLTLSVTAKWEQIATLPIDSSSPLPATELNGTVYLPAQSNNLLQLLSSTDSCRTWSILNENSVISYDRSRASNMVTSQGKLWIVDGNGNLFSSPAGVIWTKESNLHVSAPWKGDLEERKLAVRDNIFELAIINNSPESYGGTQFSFWKFNTDLKQFTNDMNINHLRLDLFHYWMEHTQDGFRFYTLEDNSANGVITRFNVTDTDIISEGVLNQNIPNDREITPLKEIGQSMISYAGGVLLSEGRGIDLPLFVADASTWNNSQLDNIIEMEPLNQLTAPMNFFALGDKLFSITSDGVYADHP